MNTNDKKVKTEPVLDASGQYCLCPTCGYYELLPVQHDKCPRCNQVIDWDWYERLKIRK